MAAYQNLASKIFCSCCRNCKEAVIESVKSPSQTQGNQQPTYSSQSQKNEFNKQNLEHTNAQYPIGQENRYSSSSSDFEELTAYNIQTGYPKKLLNRYCQEHWAFQPCLIGRP
ncbi:Tex48 [Phodopus roborovskii]|uniref:Tex48 protein n=1 Tax=Phodopus roborovskii TaxID=109678 RepID=A0AAU9ZE77_PHORO|nr:Tex48 [Phodopus roborovskii]